MIYNKHNYINKSITHIRNTYIREYDIKSAGLNIIFNKKLITEKEYNELLNMEKHKRNVLIGKWLRSNPSVNKIMMDEFVEIRKEFFEKNSINDDDVLSIKKDAIFLVDKIANVLNINNYVFVEKNKYTDYFKIEKMEFYYDKYNKELEIKGMNKEVKDFQKDFLVKDVKTLLSLKDKESIFKYLIELKTNYLTFSLPKEYYKSIYSNTYEFDIFGNLRSMDNIDNGLKEFLLIDENLSFINSLVSIFI